MAIAQSIFRYYFYSSIGFCNKKKRGYRKSWGSFFGPLKTEAPQNDPPWLPITPIFHCRILFYYKNGGICKKLDLNILKIDWAIAILSLNFVFRKKFEEFFSLWKIAITRAIFRVPSKKNFYMITDEPLKL